MTRKVFDLQCEHGHVFEGWFASTDAYDAQQAQGLLSCPVCHSQHIIRNVSAPRLNVSHLRPEKSGAAPSGSHKNEAAATVSSPSVQQLAEFQAHMIQRMRQALRNTENVGTRFAQEARSMHEGEVPERAIRGVATPEEREALVEEGIAVVPIPDFLDDDRLQ